MKELLTHIIAFCVFAGSSFCLTGLLIGRKEWATWGYTEERGMSLPAAVLFLFIGIWMLLESKKQK